MKELNNDELDVLKSIVNQFTMVRFNLTELEKRLSEIQTLQDKEIKALESLRLIEKGFLKTLEKKYGPGKLDILTLKWINYESNSIDN